MKNLVFCLTVLLLVNDSFAQEPSVEFWDVAQTKKKSEQQLKDGMQDGKYTAWYENGDIAKQGLFSKGKANGKFILYYPGKKQKAEENYILGKKHGAWKYWYINGNKAQETLFVWTNMILVLQKLTCWKRGGTGASEIFCT